MINDICGFIVSILHLDTILIFVLTLGLTHKLELHLKLAVDYQDGFLAAYVPWIPLQVIIYILIADFILFFEHYLHHKIRFLWSFHSFHHSATELNVFTGNRSHPLQAEFFNTLIAFVPMTLMGAPLASLFLFRTIRNTMVLMQHSRIPWNWGWVGKYLICSPGYHRIHHSVLPEHHDKNLAVMFPMWDFLFNTHYKGNTKPGAMGLPDNPYNRSTYFKDLLIPFRMIASNWRKKEQASSESRSLNELSPD
jgi:sterol desaturase/sphingolipid hydroxylase (fatty acid hydroxylase superfamily)